MIAPSDHDAHVGLLEKVVLVAVVLDLAAITGAMENRLEYVKQVARVRADCNAWIIAIYAYRYKHRGDYPPSLARLTQAQVGLSPPFLPAKSLYDPWGREYQYAPPSANKHHKSGDRLEIWSRGPRPNDPNSLIGNWQFRPNDPNSLIGNWQ
jgi:hypothetical protein